MKIFRINSRNGSESSVTLINELKGCKIYNSCDDDDDDDEHDHDDDDDDDDDDEHDK